MKASEIIVLMFIVCLFGFITALAISKHDFDKSLNGVGISRIAECSIETPEAHSNWYEIVWMDGHKDPRTRK